MKIATALILGALLAGCAQHKARHPGYAPDGYGVIDNSPHLPPPANLMRPVSKKGGT
ncbi:hypothetical protein [Kozakia baliensis]|uniref:hypothetical protein n=1 Tax=Kozakia baliensis TaxID=153496 RepID=UPI001362A8F8|nr:hypothetical protein [Kozakia baliensis]